MLAPISLSNISKRFQDHINTKNNYTILLTGRYGMGKTYFLRNFFQEKKDEYNVVFISPVNYTVSSNENIFELIKVDILKQLFIKEELILKENIKINKINILKYYSLTEPIHLLKNLTSSLGKLSFSANILSSVSSGISGLVKKFSELEKEINENLKTHEEIAEEHINHHIDSIGSHIEFNVISEIIAHTLKAINDKGKENILVVDDLDRLDPEHIFRILNVMSAHHDYERTLNKFGFDKIIIVCDLKNIENIYKHVYGESAEFEGYIDKFYSIEPFNFNNLEAVIIYIQKEFQLELPENEMIAFSTLLLFFINQNRLNLRKIFKTELYIPDDSKIVCNVALPLEMKYKLLTSHIQSDNIIIDTSDLPIVKVFKLLSHVFGGYEKVESLLSQYQNSQAGTLYGAPIKSFLELLIIPYRVHLDYNKPRIFTDDLTTFSYPQSTFMNFDYKIILEWNRGNPYKGDISYFSKSTISFPETIFKNKEIQYGDLFSELYSTFLFCKRTKLI